MAAAVTASTPSVASGSAVASRTAGRVGSVAGLAARGHLVQLFPPASNPPVMRSDTRRSP